MWPWSIRKVAAGPAVLWGSGLVAFAAALWAGPLQAQPPPDRTSSLSWVRLPGTESCISTQQLARAVEKRIGRRVFVSASRAHLSLEGRVERVAGQRVRPGWRATLIVSDPGGSILGERVLHVEGDDCGALSPALVLVVAIAIDPGATLPSVLGPADDLSDEARMLLDQLELPQAGERELIAQLAVPHEGPDQPVPAPTPAAPQQGGGAQSPARQQAPEQAQGMEVAVAVLVETGSLPRTAPGAALRAVYALSRRWQLELGAEYLPPLSAQGDPGGVGRFSHARLALGGCLELTPALRPVGLQLCAGAGLGLMLIEVTRFRNASDRIEPWLEGRLGLRPALRFGAWQVQLGLRAGLPLLRARTYYEDPGGDPRTLHQPSVLSVAALFGVGLRFF